MNLMFWWKRLNHHNPMTASLIVFNYYFICLMIVGMAG